MGSMCISSREKMIEELSFEGEEADVYMIRKLLHTDPDREYRG